MLNYADEHGVIAMPSLPDAMQLQSRIFEPEISRLYRRRVDKHLRRFGNHPSVCLWFMHFNLLGYNLYLAPTYLDGTGYDPNSNAIRKQRERFCLEAQRLAQLSDPRPIYHHAGGLAGDSYTLNCYLGPDQPLQEREEWPSRWAEKRPFPLMTVEHCLTLIPYWYRLRKFPLSEVYSSESLFEEMAAVYLGRRAYSLLTPESFRRYNLDKERPAETWPHAVLFNPAYQEVKSLVARRSLRAWRTYGISGIIFNAENWAYKDDQGRPQPVLKALQRWFGDTNCYIAGPEGNWPSKDHAFFAGEKVRKQIVLLNDLTRDLPCALRWRLEDADGGVRAQGEVQATARAGVPTFYPLEFSVPQVKTRTSFKLVVEPREQPNDHFQADSFAIDVFPAAVPPTNTASVVVYDPVGETTRMLDRAGVKSLPLTDKSELRAGTLLVVGKKAWDAAFLKLAAELGLDRKIREGLKVLVFEQAASAPAPFGLKLQERSTRDVFIAAAGHSFLEGLTPDDLHDLRGESDLIEPYPAAVKTEPGWSFPKRFYKWGNRDVAATFVYTKPHYAPFGPILECGFDLVESPLLEARFGGGRVVLCQMDVTSRYGADPVSTRARRQPADPTEPAG